MNIKAGFTFKCSAVWNGKYYAHFGICRKTAFLYGDKEEDIVEVVMKVSENQSLPKSDLRNDCADYWGWFDYNDNKFSFIFDQRFILNMCFPYGIESSENVGKGKAYRLEVVGDVK